MTKAVYRPGEIEIDGNLIHLDPPTSFPELAHLAEKKEDAEESREEEEVYAGPTAEELRLEAEAFKEQWATEKLLMMQTAKKEAETIIADAHEAASNLVKQQTEESESLKQQAQGEASRIIAEANEKAKKIEEESVATFEKGKKEAEEQGLAAGKEAGFAEGKAEVDRLIRRVQAVLERANSRRAEILLETEQDIIDLVLLVARKVVKVISESQRSIIISNVTQALRKVKGRGNIIIRVNMADLKLTTEHTKDFIQRMEGVKTIQVAEDSTVDPGGCIIETDFGEIDARISSQLAELETKILDMSPIKSRIRTAPPSEGT
jgi:flagellar assembly protein FliH